MKLQLLTLSNPKTQKGTKYGYLTAILHLAPANLSGHNVCPKASPQCSALCLNTAGRGGIFKPGEKTNVIQECRIRRTRLFVEHRDEFCRQLLRDIVAVIVKAYDLGLKPAIRLNGTSDIEWENVKSIYFSRPGKATEPLNIFDRCPDVQFYDYTKIPNRKVPTNYHLTFSLSENNTAEALSEMDRGLNVAVVFHKVPEEYAGRKVIDGDDSDLRFLDPKGVIVGLKAKGRARKAKGTFVK